MWKRSVNNGLKRLTGYELQRASTAAELASQNKANAASTCTVEDEARRCPGACR